MSTRATSASAVLQKQTSQTSTASAVLRQSLTLTATADTVLQGFILRTTGSAVLLQPRVCTLVSSAVLNKTVLGTFQATMLCQRQVLGTFSVDVALKRGHRRGGKKQVLSEGVLHTFSTDMVLGLATQGRTHTAQASAVLRKRLGLTTTATAVLIPLILHPTKTTTATAVLFKAGAALAIVADAVLFSTPAKKPKQVFKRFSARTNRR